MTAVYDYEIGPFRLDTTARVLTHGDAPAALGPRGVDVFRVLLEHPQEFVAKQDILDAAWPGVVVEESNLAVQISAIRRALAQAPGGDRWIETLARRGYRFVGPVTGIAGHASHARRAGRPARGGTLEWERRHLAFLQVRLLAPQTDDVARALTGDRVAARLLFDALMPHVQRRVYAALTRRAGASGGGCCGRRCSISPRRCSSRSTRTTGGRCGGGILRWARP